MTVEIRLMGETCNMKCTYCYQESVRESGNTNSKYDLSKVIGELDKVGHTFSLFGGEALLVPKPDLETIFKHGYEKYGQNGIQTNGTLIDEDHIAMFKKYNVGVGVSIDGPNELNGLRRMRTKDSDEATLESTQTIMNNLVKLRESNIPVSVIITLHRLNGVPESLTRMKNFLRWLGDIGIVNGNIHTLEVDATMPDQDKYVLTQAENAYAFLEIAKFLKDNPDLHWNPFIDMKNILTGEDDKANCTWHFCDPLNTQAVYGIEGNGAISNCGRTNKEGVQWYKAADNAYARYISFYHTPQNMGGCKGCRFWSMCGGSCPGESENRDFRNKTIHCHTIKTMLGHYEEELQSEGVTPISKSPLRPSIEKIMYDTMFSGQRASIGQALSSLSSSMISLKVVKENGNEPS